MGATMGIGAAPTDPRPFNRNIVEITRAADDYRPSAPRAVGVPGSTARWRLAIALR